jgi:hypothetical protein
MEETTGRSTVKALLRKHGHRDLLVLAARPSNERPSFLKPLKLGLEKTGFSVHTVEVKKGSPNSFYKSCARKILSYLKG